MKSGVSKAAPLVVLGLRAMIYAMPAWTYMLRCADGSYYVGCTTDLDQRIGQHSAGTFGGYTSNRRPFELVWVGEAPTIHDAIDCERRIKGWSRAKKEALAREDWASIQLLAGRRGRSPFAGFETRNFVALLSLTKIGGVQPKKRAAA